MFCFDEHTLHDHLKWNLDKFFSSSLTKKNICQSFFFFLLGSVHTTADSISKSYPVSVWTPVHDLWLSNLEIGAAQLSSVTGNRAKITFLMCKQKPCPVWFSCRRKSHPVECKDSLPCRDKDCSGKLVLLFSSTTTMFSYVCTAAVLVFMWFVEVNNELRIRFG